MIFSFDPAKLGSPLLKTPTRLSHEKSDGKGFRVSSDFIIEEEDENSNEEQPTVNMPLVQPVHYSLKQAGQFIKSNKHMSMLVTTPPKQ